MIDAGNGIAGEANAPLLDRLPLQAKRMYFEPDGSFPNHEADPLKAENLHDLQRAVLAEKADLGIAWDGDGDRAVFVDERGEAVPADLMTALFCDVILERKLLGAKPGMPFLYDLRSSRIVPETMRARGAEPVRGRVGHAFMKAVMRERGACFGGELSGHYYFRFPAGYIGDDGAAAMLLLLEAHGRARAPALGAVAALPPLPPERRDQPARRRRGADARARARRVPRRRGRRARRSHRRAIPTGGSTCARRTPSRSCA